MTAERAHVLPDLLPRNLPLVICGSAAGERSAELRQYYAGPGIRFWRTLAEVGLTPLRIRGLRAKAGVPKPTRLQGQYLALIHLYTKLHGRPPAETDIRLYFRKTPPTVQSARHCACLHRGCPRGIL